MSRSLEIFRPVLDDGANEMSTYANEIAGVLGATGYFGTLHWSEDPKLMLLRLEIRSGQSLGNLEVVRKVIEMGTNGEVIQPSLMLWGWDLPGSPAVESGRRSPNPQIKLVENKFLKPDRIVKTGDELLWKELNVYATDPRNNVRLDTPSRAALKNNFVKDVGLVTFDKREQIIGEKEFKEERRGLSERMPRIDLGPVNLRIINRSFRGASDYGFYKQTEA